MNKLIGSFTNVRGDKFSARKLTAFAFVVMIAYVHKFALTADNAHYFLLADMSGALLCLGLVTAANLIEFKNGKQDGTDK